MINKFIFALSLFSLLLVSQVSAQQKVNQEDLPPRSPKSNTQKQGGNASGAGEMKGNNKKLDFEVSDQKGATGPTKQIDQEESQTPGRGIGQGKSKGMQAIKEHASQVAQKVQGLLNSPELAGQGIGQQVRQVAQAQNQAQEKIREHVRSIESRGQVMRFLFGSDQQAVKGLEKQMQENKQRLQKLDELAEQVPTEEAQTQVEEAKSALEDQNLALDEAIAAEEKVRGIFDRISRLFK